MATLKAPFALDRSLNTTEVTPRNIADVLAEGLSHITGRTASEVEYDNTDSGLTADNVQDAIDEVNGKIPTLPTTDIQTAVDEFSTYNGGLLSSLKVSLTPNQDLHGYSEPWVGGAGKNKFDIGVSRTISGTGISVEVDEQGICEVIGTSSSYISTTLASFQTVNGVEYTLTGCPSGGANGKYRLVMMGYGYEYGDGYTFIGDGNTHNLVLDLWNGYPEQSGMKLKPMIRLATESDPTFAPYSNICPISGHTQVDVDVSDGQTTQEQITVNLGGTYYSGTLDVVSGVFVPDTAVKDLSTLTFRTASRNRWLSDSIISEVKHPSSSTLKIKFLSDSYYYTDAQNLYDDQTLIGIAVDNDGNILCRNNDANAPTGYIVYELATPTPIQLSPTMVKALVGENHLSAPLEGQEITESKYKQMFTFDDVIAYIQSLS